MRRVRSDWSTPADLTGLQIDSKAQAEQVR